MKKDLRKNFQRDENIFKRNMTFKKLNVGSAKNLDTLLLNVNLRSKKSN